MCSNTGVSALPLLVYISFSPLLLISIIPNPLPARQRVQVFLFPHWFEHTSLSLSLIIIIMLLLLHYYCTYYLGSSTL